MKIIEEELIDKKLLFRIHNNSVNLKDNLKNVELHYFFEMENPNSFQIFFEY